MKNLTKIFLVSCLAAFLFVSFTFKKELQEPIIGLNVGNILPDFQLNDDKGKLVVLSILLG